MGLFDLIEDLVDVAVEAPGKIVKETIKTVARTPELVVKTGKGAIEGVEEALEKIDDLID